MWGIVWRAPQDKVTYVGFALSCLILLPMRVILGFPKVLCDGVLSLRLDRFDVFVRTYDGPGQRVSSCTRRDIITAINPLPQERGGLNDCLVPQQSWKLPFFCLSTFLLPIGSEDESVVTEPLEITRQREGAYCG